MKNIISIFLTVLITSGYAQTGPGGVGTIDGSSDLVLWLRAGDIIQTSGSSVTQWLDASGHDNDAVGTGNAPILLNQQLYGQPTVNFDANLNQYLRVPHHPSFNSNFVSVFLVARLNDNSDSKGTFITKTSGKNLNDGFGMLRLNSDEKIRFFAGNYGVNRDSEHIHYGIFDLLTGNYRSSTSNNKIVAYVNNAGSSTTATGNYHTSNKDLIIGARPKSNNHMQSFLDGDIAEIVVMANDLPSVHRIIISNYLAAKYGFAISNDKYSFHVSHPQEVIGIGRFKDVTHENSIAGILELAESPSRALINGDFLMIGHDGESMNTISDNLPDEFSQRFTRTWRSHVNGNITREKLHFHVAGLDLPQQLDEYVLLVDWDGDGDFSNAGQISPDHYNTTNDVVEFNNIRLNTGAVFTLAFYKSITWDGVNYANGSGPNEAPDLTDGQRRLMIHSSNAEIGDAATVNSLDVDHLASLHIEDDICFTIESDIHNDGIISLDEDASLIQRTEGQNMNSGYGHYKFKRTGLNSTYGYNNWSSPMVHQALDVVFPDVNSCDLLTYSEYTQNWSYDFPDGYQTVCNGNPVTFTAAHSIVGGDGYMNVLRGYFITGNTTNPQKLFIGEINNGDYSTTIVSTEYGDNQNWDDDDWNFVGNPYPSALDPYAFWMENAIYHNRITDAIYFWDDAATVGAAYDQYNDYSSWNLTGGIASDNSSKIIDNLHHIASGQGFMVWANDVMGVDTIGYFRNGVLPDTVKQKTLVFNNAMRSCKNSQFFKTAPTGKELAWLSLTTPVGSQSKFLLGTVDGASDQIDNGYDARRVSYNIDVEFSSMVLNDTVSYSIQGIAPLNIITSNKKVNLKVVSVLGGIHTISREAFTKGGAPLKMYLRDNLLNLVHDLDNGDYQVYLKPKTHDLNRFEIWFTYDGLNNDSENGKEAITTVEESKDFFYITSLKNGFEIKSTTGIFEISVYDISGKQVYQETLTNNSNKKLVYLNRAQGMYLVKVKDLNDNIQSKKILLQ